MNKWKLTLATTSIWLIIVVLYGLTFFVKGNRVALGLVITGCLAGFSIFNLWKKIYEWLASDEADSE